MERSGYDSFVATLNNFISAKGIIGRQIAPVQLAEGMLQDAIQLLSGKTGDVDIDAADALLAKTIRTLRRLSTRGTIAIEDVFAQYASEIRAYGHSISDNLGVTEDAVDESAINHHLRDISRRCNSDLELKMQDLCDEMEQELSNIQQSGLGYELQVRLDSGLSNNPESSNMANSVVKGIAGCKDLVKGLDTNMIKSIAHIFNYKFKPWGAVKLLNGLQKWVPIAGDVLNIAAELHDQYQQSENQRKLREAKNNIVSTFNELADGFEQDGITFAREKFALPVRDILAGQEEAKAELDDMKSTIYANVLTLMGIMVAIFSLVSVNFSNAITSSISLKQLALVNIALTLCIVVLLVSVVFIVNHSRKKWFTFVYFLIIVALAIAVACLVF